MDPRSPEEVRHELYIIGELCDSGQIDRAIQNYISLEKFVPQSHPLSNMLVTVRLHLFAAVKRHVHKLLAPDSGRILSRGFIEQYMKFCGMDPNELTPAERARFSRL